jgi:hypothetical protein
MLKLNSQPPLKLRWRSCLLSREFIHFSFGEAQKFTLLCASMFKILDPVVSFEMIEFELETIRPGA